MQINNKFNIDDKVWIVYENQGEVSVYDDVISEICIDKDGLYYMLKTACIDRKEENIIAYNDKDNLVRKIEKTMEEIRRKE